MRILPLVLLTIAAASISASPSGPKLYPGAKAPKIEVSKWIKQDAPKGESKFTVVEFWATWCGPCRTSIPHLTQLAKQYEGKVDFVGVSVYERGDSFDAITSNVAKFVDGMGAQMDYHVALDTADGKMAKNWMSAAEQDGIPASFLVDPKGTVLWIGHPMELDGILKSAVDGSLDVNKLKTDYLEASKKNRKVREVREKFGKAVQLYKEGKKKEAENTLKPLDKEGGDLAEACNFVRLNDMYTPGTPESKALILKLLRGSNNSQAFVATYAYINATRDGGNKEVAAEVAQLVYEKCQLARAMQYVALAAKRLGNAELVKKAVEKGLAAIESGADKENNQEAKDALLKLKSE